MRVNEVASGRLAEIEPKRIKPLSQQELKSVNADFRDWGKSEPAIARLNEAGGPMRDFLVAALTLSPHLRDTARLMPSLLSAVLDADIRDMLDGLVVEARECWLGATEAEVMTALRRAKRKTSFLIAIADLAGMFTGAEATEWLTRIAEASIACAFDHLMRAAHDGGKLRLPDPERPCERTGLVVLGMGKLGGRELNYSSDIDVVVFFDPETGILTDPDEAAETYARMLRRLIRILQDRTGDGYVFRTDLRLRPDPGSTPLAIPVEAAMLYYEGRGQNWERAAFIKARPVGGDIAAGDRFLKDLVPFVFRKYLDYAAISDIHSIKRQIHAHRGHDAIAVKGHNIKLGRGGIREIEFFAQTQQLIAGGRMPALRARRTEDALVALEEAKWIDAATRIQLTDAYWYLRAVEHRIQMVHDEQSHSLPTTEAELRRIACMMGEDSAADFSESLVKVLRVVEKRYAQLFEQEAKLSTETGNLVFTGQADDPETPATRWASRCGSSRAPTTSSTARRRGPISRRG
jgi:glutamate-ammonia-ligase adenylyltransferase